MLTVKENFLETIKKEGNPDRLVNGYEFMGLVVPDPCFIASHHHLSPGEQGLDAFGVTWEWRADQPGAAPLPKEEVLVIKNIKDWKRFLKIPDLKDLDWSFTKAQVESIRKTDKFVTAFFPLGLFERLHFLMGFENTLVSLMIEQETMAELISEIDAYRQKYVDLCIENIDPEIFFFHDDWGTKHSLFTSPELWRKMIKPSYKKLYDYVSSKGIIIIHHADCFLEPVVSDMTEMNISVWQGVIPENDIVKLQKELDGRMVLMGGIDTTLCDAPDTGEEEVRAEVRRALETYTPGGHYIPCFSYGGPETMIYMDRHDVITDEVNKYNTREFGLK